MPKKMSLLVGREIDISDSEFERLQVQRAVWSKPPDETDAALRFLDALAGDLKPESLIAKLRAKGQTAAEDAAAARKEVQELTAKNEQLRTARAAGEQSQAAAPTTPGAPKMQVQHGADGLMRRVAFPAFGVALDMQRDAGGHVASIKVTRGA